jgi:hypothetical protein
MYMHCYEFSICHFPQVLFHSLQTNISFHTIRLILCFQQNQWDWQPHYKLGQSILVVLCVGSTLLCDAGSAPYQKSASSNLHKWFLSPTGRLNFGFILRKNLLLCSSYLPLGVSQRVLWDIKDMDLLMGIVTFAQQVNQLAIYFCCATGWFC